MHTIIIRSSLQNFVLLLDESDNKSLQCIYFLIFLSQQGGPNISAEICHIPCKVCCAPSSGFHFGAITCEGCKVCVCFLTLWLRLANKLAQNTCLLDLDGRQIGLLDSTIVPRMADKSVELIVHARHEWPINHNRDYHP